MMVAPRQIGTDRNCVGRREYPFTTFGLRQSFEDRFEPIADALRDAKKTLSRLVCVV